MLRQQTTNTKQQTTNTKQQTTNTKQQKPVQIVKEEIKNKRSNVDIETICSYMGIKKEKGVYPNEAFKDIERILKQQFYFNEIEISIMKNKFDNLRHTQSIEYQKEFQKKYDTKMQHYINQMNIRYENEYMKIEHWHYLSKEEHQDRINQIYRDKYWRQIALEPPKLIKNDKRERYIEVWKVRKPYGNVSFNPRTYYDIVCEKLKYDNCDLREKKQQTSNTKQQSIDDKYEKLIEAYKKKSIMGYKEDYYKVKHWNHLSKQEHQKRIDKIYKDKLWGMLALEEPKLVKNDEDIGYTEVWYIKKPNGIFNTNKYYDTVCEKLKYNNSDLRKINDKSYVDDKQESIDTTLNNYSTDYGMLDFIGKDKEMQYSGTMHSSKTSSNDFDEDNLKKEIDYVKNSTYRTKVIMSLDGKVKISSEIAKDTEILQNNIYNTIRQLKEHELIECINPEVKKGKLYKLTDKGEEIVKSLD